MGKQLVLMLTLAAAAYCQSGHNPLLGGNFSHAKGFSIRPAAGWTVQDHTDGLLLVPAGAGTDPNSPEVYISTVEDGYNPAEEAQSVRQLSQAFLQNGNPIRRDGERQAFGAASAYYWEVTNRETGQLAGIYVYLLPEGSRAHVVLAAGIAERLRPRDAALRQMVLSMRSVAPKLEAAGQLADSTPLAQQWLQKLRGRMVRQFWASQGMSSDKRHYLNADGTYAFRSAGMVSVNVGPYGGAPEASGSSIGNSNSTGRWRIRETNGQVTLQVIYQNGESRQFRITQDARNWYLNGEKAFAVDPE